jgi:hypothetical protein
MRNVGYIMPGGRRRGGANVMRSVENYIRLRLTQKLLPQLIILIYLLRLIARKGRVLS